MNKKAGLLRPALHLALLAAALFAATGANAEAAAEASSNPLKGIMGDSSKMDKSLPLLIKSDSLQVNAVERKFVYEGNVRAQRGDVMLTSDKMIGKYDEKNELDTVTCEKNVVITRGTDMRATSEHAFYDVKKAVVELTEAPELINKGNALTADKIRVFLNEDRSEAEGDVRVRVIQEAAEAAEAVPGLGDLQ
ncbi:MAG: hypothetical protein KDD66_09530 [Bdellovibrionales bacterium]|nr:hypothetical protein [Bdellovibrionales bacterium]